MLAGPRAVVSRASLAYTGPLASPTLLIIPLSITLAPITGRSAPFNYLSKARAPLLCKGVTKSLDLALADRLVALRLCMVWPPHLWQGGSTDGLAALCPYCSSTVVLHMVSPILRSIMNISSQMARNHVEIYNI